MRRDRRRVDRHYWYKVVVVIRRMAVKIEIRKGVITAVSLLQIVCKINVENALFMKISVIARIAGPNLALFVIIYFKVMNPKMSQCCFLTIKN